MEPLLSFGKDVNKDIAEPLWLDRIGLCPLVKIEFPGFLYKVLFRLYKGLEAQSVTFPNIQLGVRGLCEKWLLNFDYESGPSQPQGVFGRYILSQGTQMIMWHKIIIYFSNSSSEVPNISVNSQLVAFHESFTQNGMILFTLWLRLGNQALFWFKKKKNHLKNNPALSKEWI